MCISFSWLASLYVSGCECLRIFHSSLQYFEDFQEYFRISLNISKFFKNSSEVSFSNISKLSRIFQNIFQYLEDFREYFRISSNICEYFE